MTDDTNNQETGTDDFASNGETGTSRARIRRTPWRGWILAVPLAAAILVGYLAIRTWVLAGPTVVVTFPNAEGIGTTGSPVRYRGTQVGTVESVHLDDNLKGVKITLSLDGTMGKHLHSDTKFWIVQPSIMGGDFSDLLSGSYIEMLPGQSNSGKLVHTFTGLLHPPTLPPDEPGRTLVLESDHAGKLQHGAAVLYRGFPAGKVLGVSYDKQANQARIKLFIHSPFDALVSANSRFWRAGGLGVSTGSGGFGLHVPGLTSLLQGAVAFDNLKATQIQKADHHLYSSQNSAVSPLIGTPTLFALHVPGSVAGLSAGSPVRYQGILVGRVKTVSLLYDEKTRQLRTPVQIALYSSRFGITSNTSSDTTSNTKAAGGERDEAGFKERINGLIVGGLRARVATSNLILNNKQISLVMLPNSPHETLDQSSSPPLIPTVEGSGVSNIIASISHITDRISVLAGSPQLQQSIAHLNKTLANAAEITSEASGQVKPTLEDARKAIESLRETATAADSTVHTINKLAGGSLGGGPDVQRLVGELTRAAQSIRNLADYLQRHPEALLRGRGSQ